MRKHVIYLACLGCLALPGTGRAQVTSDSPQAADASAQIPTAPAPLPAPTYQSFWRPFTAVPGDFKHFFSWDTAKIFGVTSAGVMVAHRWDDDGIALALGRLKPAQGAFRPGNVGGGLYAQTGGAFVLYSIGKATHLQAVSELGGDLFRAQMLTQAIVQTMKVSFRRERPDGSSHYSMPSGHAAGAVATATVLERRYGWKVGLPAYAAAAYVGVSRMSENKHHLTDIMVGAGVGLAAGRTTTIGVSKHRFAVGVTPTAGGAAITLTKQSK